MVYNGLLINHKKSDMWWYKGLLKFKNDISSNNYTK